MPIAVSLQQVILNIRLTSEEVDIPFPLHHLQFPVKLAFSISIKKFQG
jgi:hypothetical protein